MRSLMKITKNYVKKLTQILLNLSNYKFKKNENGQRFFQIYQIMNSKRMKMHKINFLLMYLKI